MSYGKSWLFCFSFFALLWMGILCSGQAEEPTQRSTAPAQNLKNQQHSSKSEPSAGRKWLLDKNLLKPAPDQTRTDDPLVLLELFPWVREINRFLPRQFSLAEHDILLDPNQIVIRHQFADARFKRAQKNAILSLSYSGALAGGMNTRVEMPLFYSPALGLSSWERYPFGNYTMTILRGGFVGGEIYLRALTRF